MTATATATTTLPRRQPASVPPAPAESRPAGDPRWVKPCLFALLAGTAVLYLWGLGASGWANSFYSAAVQAGTKSWKAFFFGSSDAANFITVDKSPLSLWPMELGARIFGLSSWTILVPQALEGVATVGLLYATVRRWFSPGAALLAGAVLATTPVAALMFRFNNPDAMLVLLLTLGAYFVVRATEDGRTKWLVLAGSMVGLGFLAKMLQAFVVVPVFAGAYLLSGPRTVLVRIRQLAIGGLAMLASAGWWVLAVQLTPAADRPYIGGSQNNSLFNLIFGYNGFGRLTGNESGSVGGSPAGGAGRWGPTGLLRMFNADFGGQISWLLPGALILLVGGLALGWRARRTDRTRAALVLWGGWLLITAAVFSLGQGIIHPYYSVALGPAIAAIVGIGGAALWQRRSSHLAAFVLALAVGATSVWSYVLLTRSPSWHPQLQGFVLLAGLGLAVLIAAWAPALRGAARAALAVAAVGVGLMSPLVASVATAAVPHAGAIPSAAPAVAGGRFGPGGGPPGGPRPGPFGAPPGPGGIGGLLNGSTSTPQLTALLQQSASGYRWVAAAVGANEAAGYQLASGLPVMAIGGFNGTDPSPTLVQFQQFVREGDIHYFIGGGRGRVGFGGGTSSQIASWIESNFTPTTVGGVTVYDLSVG